MEINASVQLPLEQALKALIPYLRELDDPDGIWNFLDIFPDDFLFMAGHEAQGLPDNWTGYLGFISGLPNYRRIGPRYPEVPLKLELATAGVGDEQTRGQAIITHSRRAGALIELFSPRYREVLRDVLNGIGLTTDDRPWKGLGFDAWNADLPQDGRAPTGNAFVANPSYLFIVHFEREPEPSPES
jgi:hypothetical protein